MAEMFAPDDLKNISIEEEEIYKVLQVKQAAEDAGLKWGDLTDEEKKTLYRDYTGEEIAIDKMEELTKAGLGGTQAGRLFVADSPLEAIDAIGGAYMGQRKRDKLSKQKAQAYEIAGGLAAGEANAQRQHQMDIVNAFNNKGQGGPPQGQGGPPPGPPGPQTIPPTMGAGGGPASPPGTFPQGGPPIRPGQPGSPPPNAPMMDPSRGGQPAQPIPGTPQGMTDKLSGMTPGVVPGAGPQGGPPQGGPEAGGQGGDFMSQIMQKIKLDEWLKNLRFGG